MNNPKEPSCLSGVGSLKKLADCPQDKIEIEPNDPQENSQNRTSQSINDEFTSQSRNSSHPGSSRIIRLSQIASFWKWPYIIAMEATHKDIKSSKTIILYNCVNKRVFCREYQKYHVFVDVDDQFSGLVTVLVSLEFSVVPRD